MKPERIELSQTERDRLKVLHALQEKHIRQVEAARRLALSDRQVRRLLRRVQAEGDRGVVHRLRGRPSNRKIAEPIQQRALRLLRQPNYADFGPTLAADHLQRAGMPVSFEITFLPQWQQFTAEPEQRPDAHRPLGREHHLEQILSVCVVRSVAPDHTVRWQGQRWGVPREQVCAGLRGARAEIERRLDGSHWLRFRGRYLSLRPCPEAPPSSVSSVSLRLTGRSKTKTKPKPKYSPPPDHPWRRPWKRTFLLGQKPDISTLH